jgi:hypothetical protein
MNHTPTPWTTHDHSHPSDQVFMLDGTIVADCKWTKHTPEQREANATFIVQACNAHDALVEQLTLAHRMLLQTSWREEQAFMNEITAALALAQKEAP